MSGKSHKKTNRSTSGCSFRSSVVEWDTGSLEQECQQMSMSGKSHKKTNRSTSGCSSRSSVVEWEWDTGSLEQECQQMSMSGKPDKKTNRSTSGCSFRSFKDEWDTTDLEQERPQMSMSGKPHKKTNRSTLGCSFRSFEGEWDTEELEKERIQMSVSKKPDEKTNRGTSSCSKDSLESTLWFNRDKQERKLRTTAVSSPIPKKDIVPRTLKDYQGERHRLLRDSSFGELIINTRLGPSHIGTGSKTMFSSKEDKSIKEINVLVPKDKGLGASFTHEDRIRPTNTSPRMNRVCNSPKTHFTLDKKKMTDYERNVHGTSILDQDKETVRPKESQWLNKFDKYGKKGLLLIINFMFSGEKERKGSDEDVGNLCTFFTQLKYDIDCRVDMTTEELRTCLEDVRHNYLSRNSSKYHCFICVIMSHGSKRGIATTDDFIEMDEIVDYFKNDKMKKFAGYSNENCTVSEYIKLSTISANSLDLSRDLSLPILKLIYGTTQNYTQCALE